MYFITYSINSNTLANTAITSYINIAQTSTLSRLLILNITYSIITYFITYFSSYYLLLLLLPTTTTTTTTTST